MKRRIKLIASGFFALFLMTLPILSIAQQGEQMRKNEEMKKDRLERMEERIPGLSEEQKESIKSIHLSVMKDTKTLRNELGEKEARLRTLRSSDKADMDAINKQIDGISVLKASIAKREAKAHQDVRALLTEDQRTVFDTHQDKKKERARHKSHH